MALRNWVNGFPIELVAYGRRMEPAIDFHDHPCSGIRQIGSSMSSLDALNETKDLLRAIFSRSKRVILALAG